MLRFETILVFMKYESLKRSFQASPRKRLEIIYYEKERMKIP